jgi:RsiW-degrading membrane proteinase PrsW (M82 family)
LKKGDRRGYSPDIFMASSVQLTARGIDFGPMSLSWISTACRLLLAIALLTVALLPMFFEPSCATAAEFAVWSAGIGMVVLLIRGTNVDDPSKATSKGNGACLHGSH